MRPKIPTNPVIAEYASRIQVAEFAAGVFPLLNQYLIIMAGLKPSYVCSSTGDVLRRRAALRRNRRIRTSELLLETF